MLTDSKVNAAKKKDKPYRLTDGKGLFLHVATSGTKTWRIRYKFNNKESQIVIGHYPSMSLADARVSMLDVKKSIREGRNPVTDKLLKKELITAHYENTLESITRKWWEVKKPFWTGKHAANVIRSLEKDIFPLLGGIPINELTPQIILTTLQKIEKRGAVETAHRIRQRLSDVFVYAIASGLCKDNPASIIAPALLPVSKGRQPSIVELDEAVAMLQKVDDVPAYPVTKLALRFLLLTAVRPGELRFAQWEEIEGLDTNNPMWRIPATRMKMKREHSVPLCPMAVETIHMVQQFSCHMNYIFPNRRYPTKAMSENALGYLINRAGFYQKQVPHGFRSMFSTIMNEKFPQDRFVIDLVLAHINKNQVEGAYNRTTHFERRKELMREWEKIIAKDLKPVRELIK